MWNGNDFIRCVSFVACVRAQQQQVAAELVANATFVETFIFWTLRLGQVRSNHTDSGERARIHTQDREGTFPIP